MDSIEVAIGVVEGKVIAHWREPTTEISFDAKNAYLIGVALAKAALEAHRGAGDGGDAEFVAGQLVEQKVKVSDAKRDLLIAQVATILRTLSEQGKSHGYMALHCVDTVLAETAR